LIAPQESTAQQLSVEGSHFKISSTDSKVRTTLYSTRIRIFILYKFKCKNDLIQDKEKHHRKVMLSGFHLNGHTLAIYSQTQKLKHHLVKLSLEWSHGRISSTDSKVRTTLCSIINSTTGKHCSVAFI